MATGYIMLDAPNTAQPQGTYPRRGGFNPSGTCIVHTSEGDWRAGVDSLTRLVQTRTDYGCYHVAVDWADIARYYPWWWECWQDSETNNWAVGISAACRTTDWGNMPAEIEEGYYRNLAIAAADFVRYMQSAWQIDVPLRRITGAEARARVPGFCAHGDSGIARSDPGARFDWARFFRYTVEALAGGLDYASTTNKRGFLMALTDQQQEQLYNVLCTDEGRNLIARSVLNYAVPWYGFDGKRPTSGRDSVNLTAVAGWYDTGLAGQAARINAVADKVDALQKALAALTIPASAVVDYDKLADALIAKGLQSKAEAAAPQIDYAALAKAVNDDAAARLSE